MFTNDLHFVIQKYTMEICSANIQILGQAPKDMEREYTRGMYLYMECLKVAFEDEIVTSDEAEILKIIAVALDVQPSDTAELRSIVSDELPNPFVLSDDEFTGYQVGDASMYQAALIAALDDEVITEDEWALVNHLRQLVGIQEDEHALIEEAIRATEGIDAMGQTRVERLERYLTVCQI
jgi:hypothetical protein